MTHANLGSFTPEEQDLLIGLPFRAGMWISRVDDAGDTQADRKEEDRLIKTLQKLGKKNESELVEEIAAEAGRRRGSWENWSGDVEAILEDAGKAARLVSERVPEDDAKAYRKTVMQVATSVAKAYREEHDSYAGEDPANSGESPSFLDKMLDLLTFDTISEEKNISPAEDTALNRLAEALRAGV